MPAHRRVTTLLNRAKLAAVLELLSSDHAGERQAAADAAHRMVRAAGVRWADVLTGHAPPPPPPSPRPQPRPRSRPPEPEPEPEVPPDFPWRDHIAACQARLDLLTRWEAGFLASLTRFHGISYRARRPIHAKTYAKDRL